MVQDSFFTDQVNVCAHRLEANLIVKTPINVSREWVRRR